MFIYATANDYDGIASYINHLEMIETSLKHDLMSVEVMWRRHHEGRDDDGDDAGDWFAKPLNDCSDTLNLPLSLKEKGEFLLADSMI
jgi:hypothetical protein